MVCRGTSHNIQPISLEAKVQKWAAIARYWVGMRQTSTQKLLVRDHFSSGTPTFIKVKNVENSVF